MGLAPLDATPITITVSTWALLFQGPIIPIVLSVPSSVTASPPPAQAYRGELFSDAGALQPLTLESGVFFKTSLEHALKLLALHCVSTPAHPLL